MPGLIEQQRQTPVTDENVYNTTTSYDPERVQINEGQDTVQGRIQSVIDQNSPLIQGARTRAAQTSSRRGLLNSSMAVQSGEKAVFDSALPIAQQDAATYYDARTRNADAGNRALEYGANAENQMSLQAAGIIGQSRLQAEQGDISSRLQSEQGDITSRLQAEQADIEERLINADGAVRQQLLERQGQIQADLARLEGEIQLGTIAAQGDVNSRLQAERGEIDLQLQEADAATRERLLERQGEIDAQLQELRNTGAQELADIEGRWRQVIQTSQNAAALYAATADAIGSILANPDIRNNQKQSLVNQQRDLLENGLALVSGMGDVDYGDLLDFGSTTGTGNTGNTGIVEDVPDGTLRRDYGVVEDAIRGIAAARGG